MDLSRMQRMLGKEALTRLKYAHIAIFGLGGVGSFAAEAVARAGVGKITLVDQDIVEPSNINRQLIALSDTIGMKKTDVMEKRIKKINAEAQILPMPIFFGEDTCNQFIFSQYDYVIDAIDTIKSKVLLAECCYLAQVPLISSMGTGNKIDPTRFEVADIYDTSICPLARIMRRELRKRKIPKLKVVYSKEIPYSVQTDIHEEDCGRTPGSISFVPPVAGMILAGEAIKHIIYKENEG